MQAPEIAPPPAGTRPEPTLSPFAEPPRHRRPRATAERIQLYVNALKRSNQYVFNSSTAPGTPGTNREIRDLVVRTYYISPASDGRPGFPSLRRKFLTTEAGAPKLSDEEILPGVEDMQVEFGVDTGDHNSLAGIDKDADANGVPDDPNGVVSRWVLATTTC